VAGSALTNAATPRHQRAVHRHARLRLQACSPVPRAGWTSACAPTAAAPSPRFRRARKLTPTPYAVMGHQPHHLAGTLPATQLGGTVANSQLANNAVTVAAGTGLERRARWRWVARRVEQCRSAVRHRQPGYHRQHPQRRGNVGDTATSANTASTMVKRRYRRELLLPEAFISAPTCIFRRQRPRGMIYSGSTPLSMRAEAAR